MKKALRWILFGLLIFVAVAAIAFVAYTRLSRYPALPAASQVAAQAVRHPAGWLTFAPAQPSERGVILYPGGLVDVDAYAPLARAIADKGLFVVLVPMPLELAVFDFSAADKVLAAYPAVRTWAIGGHSLGGAMACQWLAGVSKPVVKGLFLWGSFCSSDVSNLPLETISIYGSNDRVLREQGDAFLRQNVPAGVRLVKIEGGNHGLFGSYGEQNGDGPLIGDRVTLTAQVADVTAQFVLALK